MNDGHPSEDILQDPIVPDELSSEPSALPRWLQIVVGVIPRDQNGTVRSVVLDGVTRQIEQYLFDLVAVGFHQRQITGNIHADLDVRFLCLGHHHIAYLIEQVRRAETRLAELHASRF